ncbi:hypothetical protein ACIBP6_06725 [Nonomuraea terrae]|uniref:hypothetical protein n=1 Tax=Nonomuraea terrae TaxID=2530383 RepID=UPI00378AC4D9
MSWQGDLLGFGAGLVIAVFAAPVGVSGAVFLLPVQLSVLSVPSPAITPANMLYNVVPIPRALARHRAGGRPSTRSSQRNDTPLTALTAQK